MIGIDTNVLVRHLVQDDFSQSREATRVITKQCTHDDPGFINFSVNSSRYWQAAYGYPKDTFVVGLEKLLRTSQLKMRMRSQRGLPFACIIMEGQTMRIACWSPNRLAGCDSTVTFDLAASTEATGAFHLSCHHERREILKCHERESQLSSTKS